MTNNSFLSERRGSNPRPRPWQGRALPTELLSHCILKWFAKLMNALYYSSKNRFFLINLNFDPSQNRFYK